MHIYAHRAQRVRKLTWGIVSNHLYASTHHLIELQLRALAQENMALALRLGFNPI